jgi:hypothetical protein
VIWEEEKPDTANLRGDDWVSLAESALGAGGKNWVRFANPQEQATIDCNFSFCVFEAVPTGMPRQQLDPNVALRRGVTCPASTVG